MPDTLDMTARGLGRMIAVQARLSKGVRRTLAAFDGFTGGLLDGTLTAEERVALGVALCNAAPDFRPPKELFDWEVRWFDARLPPAPAHLLVGACGSGREVVALLARGYSVTAFEPAESLLELARRRAPGADLFSATYESWIRDGPRGPFDAVLLGWGSLSHVTGAAERAALLALSSEVCPEGPVLLSYWPKTRRGVGRARRIGTSLGLALARIRGTRSAPSGDVWLPDLGFMHMFSYTELAELAAGCGRELHIDGSPGDYPHATFTVRP